MDHLQRRSGADSGRGRVQCPLHPADGSLLQCAHADGHVLEYLWRLHLHEFLEDDRDTHRRRLCHPSRTECTIYNDDRPPIPAGAEFNVLFIQPTVAFSSVLTQTATSSNTSGDSTCMSFWKTTGIPTAAVFVTHRGLNAPSTTTIARRFRQGPSSMSSSSSRR